MENNTNTVHLTRVVAPTITDINLVDSLKTSIDVINQNFIKLASVPFLQGVKGDTYHTSTRHIFENDKVTADGALLLNCIFDMKDDNAIKSGMPIKSIYNSGNSIIGKIENSIKSNIPGNPIDSLFSTDENGKKIYVNNDLYFYTLINDAGEEYGEQLGQYYYFVDGRIKNLSDVYYNNDKTSLSSFVDYSGFYRYVPATDSETAKYEKIGFLPTLYYDTKNNDICWKFYDNETGMSAMGPKGADGINSTLAVVKATAENENVYYGIITNSANIDDISSNNPSLWNTNFENLNDGTPVIVVFDNKNNLYVYSYAFGVVKKIGDNWNAIWSKDSIINDLLTNIKITNYLKSINNTKNDTDPKYLPIPFGSDNASQKYHTLKGDSKNKNRLILSGIDETNSQNPQRLTGCDFILDNYDIVFTDYASNEIGSSYTTISKNSIYITDGNNNTEITPGSISVLNAKIGYPKSSGIAASFENNITTYAGRSEYINDISALNNSKEEYTFVGMPIGAMIMYYGPVTTNENELTVVGNCWLLCNGASLGSNSLYKELRNKIGDTLPNMVGRSPVGAGKTLDEEGNLLEFNKGKFYGRFTNDIMFTADGLDTNKSNKKYTSVGCGGIGYSTEDTETQTSGSKPIVFSSEQSQTQNRMKANAVVTQSSKQIATYALSGSVGIKKTTNSSNGCGSVGVSAKTIEALSSAFTQKDYDIDTAMAEMKNVLAEDTVRNAISNISGGVNINNQSPSVSVNFLIKFA